MHGRTVFTRLQDVCWEARAEKHTRGTSPEEVSGPRQVRGDQQEVIHQAQKHPGHRETPQ